MLKKALAVVTIAGALSAVAATPALAAGSVCVNTNITVNGTPSPLNGEQCVATP